HGVADFDFVQTLDRFIRNKGNGISEWTFERDFTRFLIDRFNGRCGRYELGLLRRQGLLGCWWRCRRWCFVSNFVLGLCRRFVLIRQSARCVDRNEQRGEHCGGIENCFCESMTCVSHWYFPMG